MQSILNRILLVMVATVALVDATWLAAGHFAFDARSYALLFLLILPLVAGAMFYALVRREPGISAMFVCSAFLVVFGAGTSLLSYLLLTITGPRIDEVLARADQAIGFHWPALMALVARYPASNSVLRLTYMSVIPQTMLLMIVLGWKQKIAEMYRLSLALSFGAIVTLSVWTLAPSFGAFSVFTLPDAVAGKLGLVLGFDYGHSLVRMLKEGPGFISPSELRGLVGFPSYHSLQALVLMWYARGVPVLRWPLVLLNAVVLISVPIEGGHHLMDVFGGAAVTLLSIALAGWTVAAAAKSEAAQIPDAALEPASAHLR